MNIDEENKAKEFYIKSAINGIHTPRTNMVEINYLDMLKLMHSYSQEVVKNLSISGVSKRYFLFECTNADKQKIKKLIIAPDRETAIADIETNYPYIIKWYSSEELNVC